MTTMPPAHLGAATHVARLTGHFQATVGGCALPAALPLRRDATLEHGARRMGGPDDRPTGTAHRA
jgi:hypothetical protein